jgi:hypothetical protein
LRNYSIGKWFCQISVWEYLKVECDSVEMSVWACPFCAFSGVRNIVRIQGFWVWNWSYKKKTESNCNPQYGLSLTQKGVLTICFGAFHNKCNFCDGFIFQKLTPGLSINVRSSRNLKCFSKYIYVLTYFLILRIREQLVLDCECYNFAKNMSS